MRLVKQEVRRQVVPECDGEEGEGSQEVVRGCARGCPLQLKGMVRLTFLQCAHASYGRGLGCCCCCCCLFYFADSNGQVAQ